MAETADDIRVGGPDDVGAVADIVAARRPFGEADIIPALQDVQARFGYLPQPALDELARLSGVPVAKFFGVATFYSQFRQTPRGRHTVRVCRGTACHVRGAPSLLDAIRRRWNVGDGETTPDADFTLETVACLGTCFLAPVMLVDGEYFGNLTREKAVAILENMTAESAGKETDV